MIFGTFDSTEQGASIEHIIDSKTRQFCVSDQLERPVISHREHRWRLFDNKKIALLPPTERKEVRAIQTMWQPLNRARNDERQQNQYGLLWWQAVSSSFSATINTVGGGIRPSLPHIERESIGMLCWHGGSDTDYRWTMLIRQQAASFIGWRRCRPIHLELALHIAYCMFDVALAVYCLLFAVCWSVVVAIVIIVAVWMAIAVVIIGQSTLDIVLISHPNA